MSEVSKPSHAPTPLQQAPLAYENPEFLNSPDARILRMIAEYNEPMARFRRERIQDTVVFFGSARFRALDVASHELELLDNTGSVQPAPASEQPARAGDPETDPGTTERKHKRAEAAVEMARFYEDARSLARLMTEWSKNLPGRRHRFVVTSGGGPGIMEAANRGAWEAGGKTIGLNIMLPFEQMPNPYVTPELNFNFHYFFMRKYWFAYLAKALVVFPGGFGTLDEMFELLTLDQTHKLSKPITIVIYGSSYWKNVINLDLLAEKGAIAARDLDLFKFADTPEEAFAILKEGLTRDHLDAHLDTSPHQPQPDSEGPIPSGPAPSAQELLGPASPKRAPGNQTAPSKQYESGWWDTLFCMSKFAVFASLLLSLCAGAQAPPQPLAFKSHQVNPDDTITFRYSAPSAHAVEVGLDAYLKPLPMTKDANGLWTLTTPVLPPEYYGYRFIEDGVDKLDPLNSDTLHNLVSLGDSVLVPSHPPAPWELTAVPHGRVAHYLYTTHIAKNLPQNQEGYVVYTPPGYDAKHKGGYPVLYLLHGWSDAEDAWVSNGRANYIMDSLLAKGKVVPMIVVMPEGYGDMDFVTNGFGVWLQPDKVAENLGLYSQMLLTEIIPAVEREYDVTPGRDNRAITGLSMGGLESLTIGLNHPEEFAYVGGMSSAIFGGKEGDVPAFERFIPNLNAKKADLRLLWVACGKTDGLYKANRDFVAWTKSKGFDTVAVETEGAHTWLTWRPNLLELAPLLFRQ